MTKLSSVAGLDGWQSSSTPTAARGIQSDGDRYDPATVIGLKSHDEVLVIGNPAFMPWLAEVARDISSVRKPGELAQLIKENEKFDKIILPRESTFSPDLLPLISALLKDEEFERGMFIAFPPDDGWSIEQATEFYYPDRREWSIDTTFGQVYMAEFSGTTWRFIHG